MEAYALCGGYIVHGAGRMCTELFLDAVDLAVLAKSGRDLKRLGQRLHDIYSLTLLHQVEIIIFLLFGKRMTYFTQGLIHSK